MASVVLKLLLPNDSLRLYTDVDAVVIARHTENGVRNHTVVQQRSACLVREEKAEAEAIYWATFITALTLP